MACVLVTGGAGFIGSHLSRCLVREGHTVVVIDDLSLGNPDRLDPISNDIVFYKKSVCDDLSEIFSSHRFDCVFHFAALPRVQFSIQNPERTHAANIDGTFNLLLACKDHGVKRFVFSSSSSVYGEQKTLPLHEDMPPVPLSPYALHKLACEHYCRLFHLLYGLESVSLRYFNVYGPGQNPFEGYALLVPKAIAHIDSGREIVINGDGEQTRDFTYVDDIVAANMAAFHTQNHEAFGNVFNIGAGNPQSVNAVLQTIEQALGKKGSIVHGPTVIEPRHTFADITRAQTVLSWRPKTVFTEGIVQMIRSFSL